MEVNPGDYETERPLTPAELSIVVHGEDISSDTIVDTCRLINSKADTMYPQLPAPFQITEIDGDVLIVMEAAFARAARNAREE